jgi:hypothetical protein
VLPASETLLSPDLDAPRPSSSVLGYTGPHTANKQNPKPFSDTTTFTYRDCDNRRQ